jgi:hypothetical protein
MADTTFRFQPTAAAMLVGLSESVASRCAYALGTLRIIRVAHVAAACERMPVTLPRIVVVGEGLSDADANTLRERTIACGAELVVVNATLDDITLGAMLTDAAQAASKRRGGR